MKPTKRDVLDFVNKFDLESVGATKEMKTNLMDEELHYVFIYNDPSKFDDEDATNYLSQIQAWVNNIAKKRNLKIKK